MSINIKQVYEDLGQGHLFKYWDELSEDKKDQFIKQLELIGNPKGYLDDVSNAIKFSSSNSEARSFNSLPKSSFKSILNCSPEEVESFRTTGLKLIQQGKVGIILMAGGQGSRLGSSAPKGCYDIGLPSHKSLFQLQIERVRKLECLSNGGSINVYIMTSSATREPTEAFFESNGYFGLAKSQVTFFNQGTLPAVDLKGQRFLLGKDKASLIESPDGNGGLYRAIFDNKIIEDLETKGIEHIHMYCVDNILVKVADPVFIGYSASANFDIATKVVRKEQPNESVGLIVLDEASNKPCVIEYSEISKELSEQRDAEDASLLKLRAANIVNHYYNVGFLKEKIPSWISSRKFLPYHIAKKKVPSIDVESGEFVSSPSEVNGIKLEQFIFDVFVDVELAKFGCLEVSRAQEFSPLKNGPGAKSDCPETCRLDCLQRCTNWAKNAGVDVPENCLIEVSPLTSYDGEGLQGVASVSNRSII